MDRIKEVLPELRAEAEEKQSPVAGNAPRTSDTAYARTAYERAAAAVAKREGVDPEQVLQATAPSDHYDEEHIAEALHAGAAAEAERAKALNPHRPWVPKASPAALAASAEARYANMRQAEAQPDHRLHPKE